MKKFLACVFALALSTTAFAQEQDTTTTTTTTAAATDNDGDQMVGHFGVGLVTGRTVALPTGITNNTVTKQEIDMPIIGVRYWLPGAGAEGMIKRIGVDVGLGLAVTGGSFETPNAGGGTTTTDANSLFGFGIHVGAPLVLGMSKHVNFEVVPAVTLGYVTQSEPDEGTATGDLTDQSVSNFALTLGANAGFEVFFGFVGIPQLSLEALVGLDYTLNSFSSEATPVGGVKSESSASDWRIGTRRGNEPWDIFTGTVAARYYF